MISYIPFRTFRGPLFPKPVTDQELFLAVSYSKPALAAIADPITTSLWAVSVKQHKQYTYLIFAIHQPGRKRYIREAKSLLS